MLNLAGSILSCQNAQLVSALGACQLSQNEPSGNQANANYVATALRRAHSSQGNPD
ncbi:hypothetical protein MDA_GLEAN10019476 [Myotis davidii]|uniref:Uncharacterized protein n=1 Tax=Myotis davidii TaxID=225400 RepID=L5LCV7_MYODS|nr:hypothetical protein MDA_GLEAN10019476 [Myotis davidii]